MALRRPVARGQIVTWEDVAIDLQDSAAKDSLIVTKLKHFDSGEVPIPSLQD
jgi:hypothetical protein